MKTVQEYLFWKQKINWNHRFITHVSEQTPFPNTSLGDALVIPGVQSHTP